MLLARNRLRHYGLLIGLTFSLLLILAQIIGYLPNNIAYLLLNHDSDLPSAYTENLLSQALRLIGDNDETSYRGLALLYFREGAYTVAFDNWLQTTISADELVVYADNHEDNLMISLHWLKLAEQMDPNSQTLWYAAGKLCQQSPDIDDICQRFLNYHNDNWLLNTDFSYHHERWYWQQTDGIPVAYDVVACPEMHALCGYIGAETAVPEHGLSWSQCLQIESHQTYLFSAWVKVQVETNSQWQPVYIQGRKEGKPHGIGLPIQKNATGWHYWEISIVGNEFDNPRACFYPVRLLSPGQVWFYEARLTPQTTRP